MFVLRARKVAPPSGASTAADPADVLRRVGENPASAFDLADAALALAALDRPRVDLDQAHPHGAGGHIVNTSSISGFVVRDRRNGAYAATKSALVSYSEALRFDLKPSGVGVSVVLPGAVASDFYLTSAAHRGNIGGTNLFPTDAAAEWRPEDTDD